MIIKRVNDDDYFLYFPFMSNKPFEKPDGNSLLYLGTRIVILYKLELLVKQDLEDFKAAILSCWKENGLLNRGFGKEDPQRHDDYIGVCAAGHIFASEIPMMIYSYGKRHFWYYENNPTHPRSGFLTNWFWRLPGVVAHIKTSAEIKLNPIDKLMMVIDLLSTAHSPKDQTSGRIMDWLKIQTVKGKYFSIDLAIKYWEYRIWKLYGRGMGDVFAVYFSKNHPFAIYMNDVV